MGLPQFPVVRRGYEPRAVDAAVEDLLHRVEHAESTTLAARTYSVSLLDELERLHALEDELTTSLDLARQTRDAVLADAAEQVTAMISTAEVQAGARLAVAELEARQLLGDAQLVASQLVTRTEREAADLLKRTERDAAEVRASAAATLAASVAESQARLAEGRARLVVEAAEMEQYRMAIVAEASMLAQIETRLGPHLSRAAARLVEVVDGHEGIGAFSSVTAKLVHFARLVQRGVAAGTLDHVELDLQAELAVLSFTSRCLDLREGEPMVPIGQVHGVAASAWDDGVAASAWDDSGRGQEKALNISSIALS